MSSCWCLWCMFTRGWVHEKRLMPSSLDRGVIKDEYCTVSVPFWDFSLVDVRFEYLWPFIFLLIIDSSRFAAQFDARILLIFSRRRHYNDLSNEFQFFANGLVMYCIFLFQFTLALRFENQTCTRVSGTCIISAKRSLK